MRESGLALFGEGERRTIYREKRGVPLGASFDERTRHRVAEQVTIHREREKKKISFRTEGEPRIVKPFGFFFFLKICLTVVHVYKLIANPFLIEILDRTWYTCYILKPYVLAAASGKKIKLF